MVFREHDHYPAGNSSLELVYLVAETCTGYHLFTIVILQNRYTLEYLSLQSHSQMPLSLLLVLEKNCQSIFGSQPLPSLYENETTPKLFINIYIHRFNDLPGVFHGHVASEYEYCPSLTCKPRRCHTSLSTFLCY